MSYSSPVLERFSHPRHGGTLPCPHGVGTAGSPQTGNLVQMFIAVAGGRIRAARFLCFTCPVGVAACDVTAEMAENLTVKEALALCPDDVANALGGVPAEKMNRCYWAVSALKDAVEDFLRRSGAASYNGERAGP